MLNLQLFSDSKKKNTGAGFYISTYGNPLTTNTSSSVTTFSDKAKTAAAQSDARFLDSSRITNAGTSSVNPASTKTGTSGLMRNTNDIMRGINKNRVNATTLPTMTTTPGDTTGGGTGTGTGGGYFTANTASFTPSQTYLQAMNYTNQLLQQLSSGRTSYTDQINNLMNQISNREAFSYDPDTDTLFQNELSSAMQSGKTAMQDTMGQAAALTGGYGSTYATAAANQTYNSYIQDAYNTLPDYFNIALEAYNNEGQDLYNQLSMYQTADDTEYNRLASAYSANAENAANIYDQEYNNYWQTQNFNESSRQWAAEQNADWTSDYLSSLASVSADLDYDSAYQQIVAAANKYGPSSDMVSKLLTDFANQGYDREKLADYMDSYSDSATYTYNYQKNKYVDQWGNPIDDYPTFTKTGDDEYTDQYNLTYTNDQRKTIEYAQLAAAEKASKLEKESSGDKTSSNKSSAASIMEKVMPLARKLAIKLSN